MSWSAKITGMEKLSPSLLAAARLGVADGLDLLGVEGARMVQDNIATPFNGKPPAMDTQNLLNSVVYTVTDEAGVSTLVIGVSQSLQADLYAPAVETGSIAHMPPVEALLGWVQRKLGASDPKQALSLAWAIAKSIEKRGTQGHEMFFRAELDLEPLAVPVLERAVGARLLTAGGVA